MGRVERIAWEHRVMYVVCWDAKRCPWKVRDKRDCSGLWMGRPLTELGEQYGQI